MMIQAISIQVGAMALFTMSGSKLRNVTQADAI